MENFGKENKFFYVFSGSSSLVLSNKVCSYLDISLGMAKIKQFSDGEIRIEIKENIVGIDVFVIQSTCFPVNDNLMELLFIIDALKRASAKSITVLLPYYGYARQDKRMDLVVPISARLVADLLVTAGATKIITVDLHASHIEGFFSVPIDNLSFSYIACDHIKKSFDVNSITIVSPDVGGIRRARLFSENLGCDLVVVDKYRPSPNKAVVMNILGDINSKIAIIIDDMIDTAGTLVKTAKALKLRGAKDIYAYCSHPVLSGQAIAKITNSDINCIIVADTIPLTAEGVKSNKIKILSISDLLGDAILSCLAIY